MSLAYHTPKERITMNKEKLPEPPKPPLTRRIREGDTGKKCPICESSLYRKWWGLKRTNKCIHPDCENYYEKETAVIIL